jgi:hypothetical protein
VLALLWPPAAPALYAAVGGAPTSLWPGPWPHQAQDHGTIAAQLEAWITGGGGGGAATGGTPGSAISVAVAAMLCGVSVRQQPPPPPPPPPLQYPAVAYPAPPAHALAHAVRAVPSARGVPRRAQGGGGGGGMPVTDYAKVWHQPFELWRRAVRWVCRGGMDDGRCCCGAGRGAGARRCGCARGWPGSSARPGWPSWCPRSLSPPSTEVRARSTLRVRVKIMGLIINEDLTEISIQVYIFAFPLSPPAPVRCAARRRQPHEVRSLWC